MVGGYEESLSLVDIIFCVFFYIGNVAFNLTFSVTHSALEVLFSTVYFVSRRYSACPVFFNSPAIPHYIYVFIY